MGSSQTKDKNSPSEKAVENLKNKVRLLRSEINEAMLMRETENRVFKRELRLFAFKESEWRRERKRLKEEVKRLLEKSRLEEEGEERSAAASLDHHHQTVDKKDDEAEREAAWREVTVEKWKKLYFAIKAELDDLIERTTHQEQRLCWNAEEEEIVMQLNNELKSKEEKMQLLQAKLAYVEDQKLRKEREIDILRQSLRIMSHRKKATTTVTSLAKIKTSNPRKKRCDVLTT